MKLKDVIFSWDLLLAITLSVVIGFIMPNEILSDSAQYMYYIAASVLSIIFSLYFAAFAILIAFPSDDFIRYIEQNKIYTQLLSFFRFTLFILLFGLIGSVIGYSVSSFQMGLVDKLNHKVYQNSWWITIYSFLFWYSLFAAFDSILSIMKLSDYKSRFLQKKPIPNNRKLKSPAYSGGTFFYNENLQIYFDFVGRNFFLFWLKTSTTNCNACSAVYASACSVKKCLSL